MFIGRKEELNNMMLALAKPHQNILIYGKRRIGKTTLAKEVSLRMHRKMFLYECLKTSLEDNLKEMTIKLKEESLISDGVLFDSMISLFRYLDENHPGLIVVVDEYPYLKENESSKKIDSTFQNIIDNHTNNINIIISGSYVSMMKNLLLYQNELFGRFALIINLKELNYLETSEFYPQLSNKDKIAFYSVFGGSPFVNSLLDFSKSLEWNIKNHLLNIASPINLYIEFVVLSELLKEGNASSILGVIKNGKKKYSDIITSLNYSTSGLLDKHLKTLLDMDIIDKIYPINKKEDNHRSMYEISDNLLRFYYTYIYKNKSTIVGLGIDRFYEVYISLSINEFISRRFERISRDYFSISIKKGKNKDIIDIGTYFYDNKKEDTHGEFDCVVKYIDNTYGIYEAKYLSHKIKEKDINKEISQINGIKEFSIKTIGFFLISGYESQNKDIEYIDGNDIYDIK